MRKIKLRGLVGEECANQNFMEEWAFETSKPSTLPCWPSKDGESSQTQIL